VAKLGFLKTYRAAVSAGHKTTTLRRWKRPMLRAGQIVGSDGIGRIEIAAVEPVEWDTLTQADAQADGFDSLADLQRALRRIYRQIDGDGRSWFKIRFRVTEGNERAGPKPAKPPRAKPIRARAAAHRERRGGGRAAAASGTMSLGDKLKLARAVRQRPRFGAG
jgi:hypothetical protein